MSSRVKKFYAEERHSRLGIASVVIGILLPILLLLLIMILMLLKDSANNSLANTIFGYVLAGLGIFALIAPMLHFVGVVIGIIGWVSKKTKNVFPIIGTILNAVLGIIGIVLFVTLASLLVWVLGNVPVH